jgi:hypothetical protein
LGIEAAFGLGISCHVTLPYDIDTFRNTSVIDRPGPWDAVFHKYIERLRTQGRLTVLSCAPTQEAFRRTNHEILRAAKEFPNAEKLAVVVWDGKRRTKDDFTAEFLDDARLTGFSVREISTCD